MAGITPGPRAHHSRHGWITPGREFDDSRRAVRSLPTSIESVECAAEGNENISRPRGRVRFARQYPKLTTRPVTGSSRRDDSRGLGMTPALVSFATPRSVSLGVPGRAGPWSGRRERVGGPWRGMGSRSCRDVDVDAERRERSGCRGRRTGPPSAPLLTNCRDAHTSRSRGDPRIPRRARAV
jgi:hypothetical protein